MSGIFSVVSDYKSGMFRLNQTSRPWDDDGKASTLAEKAEAAQQSFGVDPAFIRGAEAARTAMEEAKKITGPKSAAQDRLARAEQRLKEIQQEVRLALARGDRDKLMALAREAAILAKQAGKAAKEYASGVAAAAAMGIGGDAARTIANGGAPDPATGANGPGMLAMSSSTTISVSSTTVQVRQIELSLNLTIRTDGTGGDGASTTAGGGNTSTITLTASSESLSVDASNVSITANGESQDLLKKLGLPSSIKLDGLPQAVGEGLAATGRPIGGFGTPEGRNLLNAMIQDNEAKASRYKEADAFARRVEGVVNGVKSIFGQVKVANMEEANEKRRTQRRKELDDMDKELDETRDAVNDLRASAYGSSDALGQLMGGGGNSGGLTTADAGSIAAAGGGDATAGVASAPMVDITA